MLARPPVHGYPYHSGATRAGHTAPMHAQARHTPLDPPSTPSLEPVSSPLTAAQAQAQSQAQLDASREAARMAAFEPQERVGFYGQGVTGLMGGYPAQTTTTNIPNPTPLQTALGVGSTLAGIYGTVKNAGKPMFNFNK